MANFISKLFGRKRKGIPVNAGGYDVAKTTRINQELYSTATSQSGDAVNSEAQRKILRNRARYEYRENSFFKSMNDGRAEDVVGRGPRLQLNLGKDNEKTSEATERDWIGWARAINLASKLKIAEKEVGSAGEAFIVVFSNSAVRHPIKLDVMLVEADRVTTPSSKAGMTDTDPLYVDGITFDTVGNPVSYDILNYDPGDNTFQSFGGSNEFTPVEAKYVYHWFDKDRPSAHRGVPAITSGLQLFSQLRRYTQSVVLASETAADMAYILRSQSVESEDVVESDPFESISMEKGIATTLPKGWIAEQLKPEQPTNNYPDFKRSLVVEIGRSMRLPANVSLGDSSGYNYASGRLDKQEYHKTVTDRQNQMGIIILDGILFDHWLPEASRLQGAFNITPSQAATISRFGAWEWYWDGFEHVDPVKEANAQDTRLSNNTTTYKDEYSKAGKDWIEQFNQIAIEKAAMEDLGITPEDMKPESDTQEEAEDGEEDEPEEK